jgi:hypothetical protein
MIRTPRQSRIESTPPIAREKSDRGRDGAVTLETVLLIGAIALPVLIFLLRFGWPRVRDYFQFQVDILQIESDAVSAGE